MIEDRQVLRCPVCNKPLRSGIQFSKGHYKAVFLVYCGFAECSSYAANDGGSGATLSEAIAAFDHVVSLETAKGNTHP